MYVQNVCVALCNSILYTNFASTNQKSPSKPVVHRSERSTVDPKPFATLSSGNRPSLSIMLPSLNAYTVGQLLAIYEHRVAVQGFVW